MKLHIEPAEGLPFIYSFEQDSLIIGRASTSDLALSDPFLSRHHARLFRDRDAILVEDLGSRNGTQLNGESVLAPTEVRTGDVLTVSGSRIHFGDGLRALPDDTDIGATIYSSARDLLDNLGDDRTGATDTERDVDRLRQQASRLQLLNELHEALGSSISLEELLRMILDRAFEHLRPEQGCLFLRQGDTYLRAASRTVDPSRPDIPLSRKLLEEVCEKGMAALVLDTTDDIRFAEAQSLILSGLRSLIAAPLLDAQGTLGMIVLSSTAGVRQFEHSDLELLVTLASIAALKIRNAALAEEAMQRRRLEADLALARRIQESLLPTELPDLEGLELFARNLPSRGVSGDYYQVVGRNGNRECVVLVSDVSGKGIPASLLTASLEALCAAPIDAGQSPAEICNVVSRHLHRRSPPEKYATAFLGIIELDGIIDLEGSGGISGGATSPAAPRGAITFTNAGHNPALLVRSSGDVQLLSPRNMPLGLIANAQFTNETVPFLPGDLLVVYTDGITEAESGTEEEFGIERLMAVVREQHTADLEVIAETIDTAVQAFTANASPSDDRTLLLARRI
jgi:serine phosphatase RsbU (regulator of sigma subunit)